MRRGRAERANQKQAVVGVLETTVSFCDDGEEERAIGHKLALESDLSELACWPLCGVDHATPRKDDREEPSPARTISSGYERENRDCAEYAEQHWREFAWEACEPVSAYELVPSRKPPQETQLYGRELRENQGLEGYQAETPASSHTEPTLSLCSAVHSAPHGSTTVNDGATPPRVKKRGMCLHYAS